MNNGVNTVEDRNFESPHEKWRSILYKTLRDSPRPLFIFDRTTIPAASIWSGARLWIEEFRQSSLQPGDALFVNLPPSPAFIQVLTAAFWTQTTLVLSSSNETHFENITTKFPVRGRVSFSSSKQPGWKADYLSGPTTSNPLLSDRRSGQQFSHIRLILSTSGTTGKPSWYGLSDGNILSVLNSHNNVLGEANTAVSYLPWDHAFGLVLGLLQHILRSRTIIRDPAGGRDTGKLVDLIRDHEPDYMNMVPSTVKSLAEYSDSSILSSFEEGIVGGAPIQEKHAQILNSHDLRVGYGQTEASPGITLGNLGEFSPGLIGSPVGCKIRINKNELEFYGYNAVKASLENGILEENKTPRWVSTGDLVDFKDGKYFFSGRIDNRIQLDNGKTMHAPTIEKKLREDVEDLELAFLCPKTSSSLILFYSSSKSSQKCVQSIKESLGQLSNHIDKLVSVDKSRIVRTENGSINRTKSREELTYSRDKRTAGIHQ